MGLATGQVQHIGHDVVECREQDAAVHGVAVADVIFGRRKRGGTDTVLVQRKRDTEPHRVVHAARKTHGCGLQARVDGDGYTAGLADLEYRLPEPVARLRHRLPAGRYAHENLDTGECAQRSTRDHGVRV